MLLPNYTPLKKAWPFIVTDLNFRCFGPSFDLVALRSKIYEKCTDGRTDARQTECDQKSSLVEHSAQVS